MTLFFVSIITAMSFKSNIHSTSNNYLTFWVEKCRNTRIVAKKTVKRNCSIHKMWINHLFKPDLTSANKDMSENSDKRLRNLRSLSIYKKIEKIWIILLREWRKQFIIKNHDVSPLKKIARTHTQWQRLRELKEAINHSGKKISVCVCIHHWEKYKRHDEWICRHTTEAFLWWPHWKACDVIWIHFLFCFLLF